MKAILLQLNYCIFIHSGYFNIGRQSRISVDFGEKFGRRHTFSGKARSLLQQLKHVTNYEIFYSRRVVVMVVNGKNGFTKIARIIFSATIKIWEMAWNVFPFYHDHSFFLLEKPSSFSLKEIFYCIAFHISHGLTLILFIANFMRKILFN